MATADRTPNGATTSTDDAPEVEVVKASFNLPVRELDALRDIARRRSINVTQALRQAIAVYVYFANQREGTKCLLEDPEGNRRELVFHNA